MKRPSLLITIVGLVIALALPSLVSAQPFRPTYSIDYQSFSKGTPELSSGIPITEGDILGTTWGPGMPPTIVISGGFGVTPPGPGLGLPAHPNAVGVPFGIPGNVEVDALSYGTDLMVTSLPPSLPFPRTWLFSVDEFAFGLQNLPVPLPPNVSTEGAFTFFAGPPPPGQEASADLFTYFPPGGYPPGIGPVGPMMLPPGNFGFLDGDGFGPSGVGPFSLGLQEPNQPNPGPFDFADNLDAVDVDTTAFYGVGPFPIYFSLDSGPAVLDPIEGVPGSGSAALNVGGAVGGDVLVTLGPGPPPLVYAPATLLGLDIFGPNTDDLDALVLRENGDGFFTPSVNPYDWENGIVDMLFFSVRRGSAIIGTPDFFFGLPIEAGDILTPAGPPGSPPGIWMAAESLGLCPSLFFRAAMLPPGTCPGGPWGPFGDDLNALDFAQDCNDDGIPDAIEIETGLAPDANMNGIPDNCEQHQFIRGNCNADATFDIADAVYLLGYLFPGPGGPYALACDAACDSNDDDALDIADAITILNGLFGSPAVPPPAPHPSCGLDPTPGVQLCISFPPCP